MFFVKREYLDAFTASFRYTEQELNMLKDLYVEFATPGFGLSPD
jgi:hypothetical protein